MTHDDPILAAGFAVDALRRQFAFVMGEFDQVQETVKALEERFGVAPECPGEALSRRILRITGLVELVVPIAQKLDSPTGPSRFHDDWGTPEPPSGVAKIPSRTPLVEPGFQIQDPDGDGI